jgi:hypothetical protein
MREDITIHKIYNEIQNLSVTKLTEVYNFINRLKIKSSKPYSTARKILKFAGSWKDIPVKEFGDFVKGIRTRRAKAFSRRKKDETGFN